MTNHPFNFDEALKQLQSGKNLLGTEGILTPLIKKLTEAALEVYAEMKIWGHSRHGTSLAQWVFIRLHPAALITLLAVRFLGMSPSSSPKASRSPLTHCTTPLKINTSSQLCSTARHSTDPGFPRRKLPTVV